MLRVKGGARSRPQRGPHRGEGSPGDEGSPLDTAKKTVLKKESHFFFFFFNDKNKKFSSTKKYCMCTFPHTPIVPRKKTTKTYMCVCLCFVWISVFFFSRMKLFAFLVFFPCCKAKGVDVVVSIVVVVC